MSIKLFAKTIEHNEEPSVTRLYGLYPVLMAVVATKSQREGRTVKIEEVE